MRAAWTLAALSACCCDGKTIFEVGVNIGSVMERDALPDAETLWKEHIATGNNHFGKPFVIRGYAKSFPAFDGWASDDDMAANYGDEEFDIVETETKETRQAPQKSMKLHKFMKNYAKKGWYAVASIPKRMRKDVLMPHFFRCGNLDKHLHDVVLWQGGNSTKSVIHSDAQDSFNCQLSGGTKKWLMWSPKYTKKIQSKKMGWVRANRDKDFQKAYGEFAGRIDVDNVDLATYPGWDELERHEFELRPGDCLFFPRGWFHTVWAPPMTRVQNILWWWFRPDDFNSKECAKTPAWPAGVTLTDCTWGWDHGVDFTTRCTPQSKGSPQTEL
eukprot:TRINITY_DN43512_c0_g2_i1.p1 TRINITY_DN43512_c0_g2~~TRINITY_DN43512_c0_g2_i1.p1  ORF type:complete len:329 (+),score=72.97 TRINITY_DN43512_c0_g2_i1:100-1086(+)